MCFETPQFKIRIDEIGNNKFRYASWPSETSMSKTAQSNY